MAMAAAEGSPAVEPAASPLTEGNDDEEEAEPPQEEEEEEDDEAAGPSSGSGSAGFRLTAVRREPAVRLQHGVSGVEPLAWSEDHRVSVCTARSIAVLEQLSDVQGGGGGGGGGGSSGADLVIHRTAVPAPAAACHLKVLIGHILKKMNKQTFPEHCSLCKEILPFTDRKQAVCSNGHIWLRCFLTYQACQSLVYRRCLLRDSIARNPTPEDPDWIKRLLQGPCSFCDSPVF
uniref:Ral transcription factor IIIC subunit 4 n=1 Tax=Podarcis muralis TaxID=64176 RepID=A0A670KJG1_PODMU